MADTKTKELIPRSNMRSQNVTARTEPARSIEQMIYTLRDIQVILDEDIANLYGVKTKRLNQQVKRNIDRFESDFMFQLTAEEFSILRSQNVTASWGGRRSLPFAFTELGVAMLSSVLTSKEAVEVNKQILRAFSAMRRFLISNAQVFQRLDNLDHVQKYVFRISATHSHRLEYAVARVSVWDGAKLPFATHQGTSNHTTGHTVVWQIRERVPFHTSADHPFRCEAPRRKTHTTERELLFATK